MSDYQWPCSLSTLHHSELTEVNADARRSNKLRIWRGKNSRRAGENAPTTRTDERTVEKSSQSGGIRSHGLSAALQILSQRSGEIESFLRLRSREIESMREARKANA
eukprot:scaffold331686_cov46-Prasinocladus_malaysianus.AAC.1